MSVSRLSTTRITTTIDTSENSASQDNSVNETDLLGSKNEVSRSESSSSHSDGEGYTVVKSGGDSPEKTTEIRLPLLRFTTPSPEDQGPPPLTAPRTYSLTQNKNGVNSSRLPSALHLVIPETDEKVTTAVLSLSLDGKRPRTPIPGCELSTVQVARRLSDDLSVRRFSDGNLPGSYSSVKKTSNALEVLATPRDYSKPPASQETSSSSRTKPKKESPRKGSWPPFLTLRPTYKMGAHSPRMRRENSTVNLNHSPRNDHRGILLSSLAACSTSMGAQKLPEEEWRYIAKLATAPLRYDVDKAAKILHRCLQIHPNATADILERLVALHDSAEKKRTGRWNDFVYKFFLQIDSPEKAPFFSAV
ncbi:MAG: hypothetical protein V4492_06550, partial [Chlamydiota bacterium]